MASQLLRFLENIDNGRKSAIKNAKAAGLPATDNMSISALGDLFRYQNNKEEIIPLPEEENQVINRW
jgi:hypothetical protein